MYRLIDKQAEIVVGIVQTLKEALELKGDSDNLLIDCAIKCNEETDNQNYILKY